MKFHETLDMVVKQGRVNPGLFALEKQARLLRLELAWPAAIQLDNAIQW